LSIVSVVGDRLSLHFAGRTTGTTPDDLQRQALVFGHALNADLAELRFGVVGCGATGSAVAMLLARVGARRLFAVDRDVVEATNLNRLHGADADDARERRLKVDVLKRHVEGMDLGVQVVTHAGWIGDEACRDAIRACDVVFGCTDDHDGRLFLNRLAYFYLSPVFDVGFKLDVADGDPPRILDAAGRVTVLMPGSRCLLCRNVVDPNLAREEYVQRTNPEEYAWQHDQRYVHGDGGPSPAVVTFTTDLACMAIDELLHRLTGYRRAGSIANRVRKYHLLEDKRPGPSAEVTCPICFEQGYWGRGDIAPFLDRIG
jgi:molybdopterin/thiamine biosynthesis adenylyltransferase